MELYTRDGKALQVIGDFVYSRSGEVVGKIHNKKVYGTDGIYVGTIESDRLIYRSPDSASNSSPFSSASIGRTSFADRGRSSLWGDEPDIPD